MDTVLDLSYLIYDAVSDGSRWQMVLEALACAMRCHAGAFSLWDHRGINVSCWYGYSNEDVLLYVNRYAADDPWRVGASRIAEGQVSTSEDLCPPEEIEQSVAYREFYGPRGVRYGVGGNILHGDAGMSSIILARGKEGGPCGEPEKSILCPLMPHLRRAALLYGELSFLHRQLGAFTDHLDRYSHPFFLTDIGCRVLYSNVAAREMAAVRDGVTIQEGRLAMMSEKENAALGKAVAGIAAGSGSPLFRLAVSRPSRKKPYRLLAIPVPDSGSIPLGVAQPAAAVLIMDAESGADTDPAVLQELFTLTPAEARVTAKLVQGRSAEEIANETGVSLETIRTHIRRILAKTSTGRQGELISLVLRNATFGRF